MSQHQRTAIRRLSIHRYRSLRSLCLEDLPPLIVLHGPNGSGKSSILRALQLLLRAASLPRPLPRHPVEASTLSLPEADRMLDLRLDDFRAGDLPEIRVSVEITLGTRAREIVGLAQSSAPSLLVLEAVFQSMDDRSLRFWFQEARLDGRGLVGGPQPNQNNLLDAGRRLQELQRELARIGEPGASGGRAEALLRELHATQENIRQMESQLEEKELFAARVHRVLIPSLLQVSEAYRVPGGGQSPEGELYRAFLSENPREREAARRLSKRLARAGLFGAKEEAVELIPVNSQTYGEKQVRLRHPRHGELSLRNLGTGEQQLVMMLGQRVITPYPIAQIEEPEAHLHKELMGSLARVLRDSVQEDNPDVDQLWIATHHRMFSIAPEFFDVTMNEAGETEVRRRKSDEAATHFYEPSPYWKTLENLVTSGMSPEAVVYQDEQGRAIRTRDVLASLRGEKEPELAIRFVDAATRAFVLSLITEPDEHGNGELRSCFPGGRRGDPGPGRLCTVLRQGPYPRGDFSR